MAQPLRRPLFHAVGLSSSSSLQRRQFTQVPARWARIPGQARARSEMPRSKAKAEKSLKVMQKMMMARGEGMSSDIGLLEQTFVPPITKYSAVFTEPRTFLRFQYYRYRSRLRDFISLLVIKLSSPGAGRWFRKSLKLKRRAVRPKALELHQQMYRYFADGDIDQLRELCTEGLMDSFQTRIEWRARDEKVRWELLKYNGRPKVVSDRATMYPVDGMALRQAVVRIASRQRWTRTVGGKVVEGSGEARDVVEYVVVQNTVKEWKMQSWKVWGMTGVTTAEDVESWRISMGDGA